MMVVKIKTDVDDHEHVQERLPLVVENKKSTPLEKKSAPQHSLFFFFPETRRGTTAPPQPA